MITWTITHKYRLKIFLRLWFIQKQIFPIDKISVKSLASSTEIFNLKVKNTSQKITILVAPPNLIYAYCLYIAQTGDKLQERMSKQRYDIKIQYHVHIILCQKIPTYVLVNVIKVSKRLQNYVSSLRIYSRIRATMVLMGHESPLFISRKIGRRGEKIQK